MLTPHAVRVAAAGAGIVLMLLALWALLTPNLRVEVVPPGEGHFLLFASLGVAVGGFRAAGRRRGVLIDLALLLAMLLIFATLSELSQLWIDGRSPQRTDWVADAAGAAAGIFGGALISLMLVGRPSRGR
jgi:VanZ family protein